jgi:SAM-dependent methyltransferase
VCGLFLRAFVDGYEGRPHARCPRCDSLERHRHLWLFLARHTPLVADRSLSVLHFAPERGIGPRLARGRPGYASADLEPGAMLQLDVQDLDLPDESFDWVLCSHVLEHVPDDRAAMRELLRVLRPGGTAIVQVPTYSLRTDEDVTLTPEENLARFGQRDHVRIYGADVFDRLRAAGFEVDLRLFRDELSARERDRYGLDYHGVPVDFGPIDEVWTIPLCRRPTR